MSNISTVYDLKIKQPHLDFIDVKIDKDNKLFVDPRLIEIAEGKMFKEMHFQIEAFWGTLVKYLINKDKKGYNKLLSGISEPNETKLGYSSNKVAGNSVAIKLKEKLIDKLSNNNAIKSGNLSHFGDIELFIEDIGCDRISDITTKIIKSTLISYTQQQCELLDIKMETVPQKDIFDRVNLSWNKKDVLLPVCKEGKPILFVPKIIVRRENSSNSNIGCFYRFALRNFISKDLAMIKGIKGSGKEDKVLLRDIRAKYKLSKKDFSMWILKYGKLLVDYKTEVMNIKLRPMNNGEIEDIVYS
jgi:hypothetical protein